MSRVLTRRECEVLELLDIGFGRDAIAERMGVSRYTVRAHVDAIRAVLGRPEARDRDLPRVAEEQEIECA